MENNGGKNKLRITICIVAGIVAIIGVVVGILVANGVFSRVTICTKMDYRGSFGSCIKTETVEIVAVPNDPSNCPVNTEPVYDTVGGFVGVEFVGCAKKQ